VSGPIAKSAILELVSRGDISRNLLIRNAKSFFAVSSLCAVVLIGLFFHSDVWRIIFNEPLTDTPVSVIEMKTNPHKSSIPVQARKSLPETEKSSVGLSGESEQHPAGSSRGAEPAAEIKNDAPSIDFQKLLNEGSTIFSKRTSFESLLNAWGITRNSHQDVNEIADDSAFFSLAAQQSGMVVTPIDGDLERIVRLNIPAILKFNLPFGTAPVYLTVIKVTPDAMIFSGTDTLPTIAVPYARIMENWSGSGFVFWKNFYNYQGTIPVDAPGESIITLKLHLRDIGYQHIQISGTYDLATRMTIKAIQARHGIPIDGYVGPLTKIVLYNEKQSLVIPHLWEQMKIPAEVAGMQITQKTPERVLPNPEPSDN
jgi:general secretion pathway protein A